MTDRAADIVSPITDRPLPDKTTAADARAEGRFGHDKPTVDNSIVLLKGSLKHVFIKNDWLTVIRENTP